VENPPEDPDLIQGGVPPAGPRNTALILVVDRDPHVRELEAYFLQEAGHQVEFAEDGVRALDLVRDLSPDILITEILVPELDGLALCRAIKQDPATARTAVLVFSILAAAHRAREAGADAFLLKPLSEQKLTEVVRDLLDARHHQGKGKGSDA